MAGTDLRKACLECFQQVAGDGAKDALVYLDGGAGEAFHFMGGFSTILEMGAKSVCSLENASSLDGVVQLGTAKNDPICKLLIVTSCLLSDAHRYILRCLRSHSFIKDCLILTSISEEAHSNSPDTPLGPDAFHEYKRLLLEDINRISQNQVNDSNVQLKEFSFGSADAMLRVEVKHFPMMLCPLTSRAFVFPSRGTVARAPLCNKSDKGLGFGLPRIDKGPTISNDDYDDDNIPTGGALLAHFLSNLAGQFGWKFDVFTLGPLSHDVGKLLTELPDVSGWSKRSASLLLIDRTLDLITPSCHGDCLIDRFFASFPKKYDQSEGQKTLNSGITIKRGALDIRLPDEVESTPVGGMKEFSSFMSHMNGIVNFDNNTSNITTQLLSTSGRSLFDSVKRGHVDLIFETRVKESLLEIKKWLHEALHQEKLKPNVKIRLGALSGQEINLLCQQLSENIISAVRHSELIQISKAIEFALGPTVGPKWEALSSAEKVLFLSVGDSSQSVAFQILDLVHQSMQTEDSRPRHSLFSLQDALTLAIVGYGLAGDSFGSSVSEGPFSWEEERKLKQAVTDAVLQGCEPGLGFLNGLEEALKTHRQFKESGSTVLDTQNTRVEPEPNEEEADTEGWDAWDDDDAFNDTGKGEGQGGGYGELQLKREVQDRVEDLFKRLHLVSQARKFLPIRDRSLPFDDMGGFSGSPEAQRSLLYRILSLVFAKAEVPGMEHHSSTTRSLLGRFGLGQAKQKPSDNKTILVFVIGGVNGLEVLEAKEAQATCKSAQGIDVFVGGTTFLTPDDIFDLVIGSSSH